MTRFAWVGIGLGALVACTPQSDEAATDGGSPEASAPEGGAGPGGGSPDSGIFWGVRIRLVDQPPLPPDNLAGLHLHVTGDNLENDPLAVDLAWPTSVGSPPPMPGATQLMVLQGCGGPDGICSLSLGTSNNGCGDGVYPNGCLSMEVESLFTLAGRFVHPNGTRCRLNGGNLDAVLQVTTGKVVDQTFLLSDDTAGTFSLPCWDDAGSVIARIEGTFQLGVWRAVLIP